MAVQDQDEVIQVKNGTVILAHPEKGSFNHAISEVVCHSLAQTGYGVYFHDLYEEQFDPLLRGDKEAGHDEKLEAYGQELSQSSIIVIIHPNWWGQPPAILKGWVDRVFRLGIAYRYEQDPNGKMIRKGALPAKQALIINTANVPAERELQMGNTLDYIWKDCTFEPCGVPHVYRKSITPIVTSTYPQRQAWLKEIEEFILQLEML